MWKQLQNAKRKKLLQLSKKLNRKYTDLNSFYEKYDQNNNAALKTFAFHNTHHLKASLQRWIIQYQHLTELIFYPSLQWSVKCDWSFSLLQYFVSCLICCSLETQRLLTAATVYQYIFRFDLLYDQKSPNLS